MSLEMFTKFEMLFENLLLELNDDIVELKEELKVEKKNIGIFDLTGLKRKYEEIEEPETKLIFDSNKRIKCGTCNKTYSTKGNLTIHLKKNVC